MDEEPEERVRGRPFQKGHCYNPRGRPPKDRTIEKLCKDMTEDAVDTLHHIMLHGKKDSDRREAAKIILQYGWGKPRSEVEVSGQLDIPQLHLQALKELNAAARAGRGVDDLKLIEQKSATPITSTDGQDIF